MEKNRHSLARVYHPYQTWEEYHHKMWGQPSDKEGDRLLHEAIAFTGDAKLYGSFMRRVTTEWPISCEQNLLHFSLNRKAWLGHAACCLALGCPEHITRKAWWYLSQEQQDEANGEAERAIQAWEDGYAERLERNV